MSNSFGVLSTGSSSDSSDSDGTEDNLPLHQLSPLQLRLHAAELLLAQRDGDAFLQALLMFESIRDECRADESDETGALIRCHAHSGTAHMRLALLDCKKEEYEHALFRYEAAIADMECAMQLCHASTASLDGDTEQLDRDGLERDRLLAAKAISMDLEHVTQLRDDLLTAQQRKQAALDRSCQARDEVKLLVGDTKWKALRGKSQYAEKRLALQRSLRAIQVALQKIDDTGLERERLRQFGEQQKVIKRERKERKRYTRQSATKRKMWVPVQRHKQQ